jgi:hypothetical protein
MGYRLNSPSLIPGSASFLFCTTSSQSLGPAHPPTQSILGAHSLRVKWQGHEADYSSPSSAEVKKSGAIPPLPHMSSLDNFTLYHFYKAEKNCIKNTFITQSLYCGKQQRQYLNMYIGTSVLREFIKFLHMLILMDTHPIQKLLKCITTSQFQHDTKA